jgi:hypothetical protein
MPDGWVNISAVSIDKSGGSLLVVREKLLANT